MWLFLSGFCGCAGVIARRFLVFIFNENEMTMVASYHRNFDAPCVLKVTILLMFVLCGCVFQVLAVLVSTRGDFLASYHKIFDTSCVLKLMILLIFVLCCSVFQKTFAALVSLREGSFIFFCAVLLARIILCQARYISMSVSLVYMRSGWYLTQ